MPKTVTTVVNIKRGGKADVYIGRPSPFGNPYAIGPDGDRTEVIRLFKIYFYERLKREPVWEVKVQALKGKTLGCFCFPQACHGSVIAEYLDSPRSSNR